MRKPQFSLLALVCLLLALCAGCGKDATQDTKQVILTFESIDAADELVCIQGSGEAAATVTVRPNGLLSQSELDALAPGDQLTVSYDNRTGNDINATGITVDHVGGADEPAPAPDEPTPDAPTDDEPDDAPALHVPENETALIAFFEQELFADGSLYLQALTCDYASPAEVDLCQLFYNGIPGQDGVQQADLTAPERSALEKDPLYWPEADIDIFTTAEMNDALARVFGIGLGGTEGTGLQRFVYLPEFDRYYFFHTDINRIPPIEISQVQTDGNGYYYLRYRAQDGADKLCCLRQDGDHWTLVYNLDAAEDVPLAPAAPAGAEQTWDYMPLRPAVSDDLEQAVTLLLREELWTYTPSDSALRAEAHDILGVRRVDDQVEVYAIVRWNAYDTGHGERTEIYHRTECVRLSFWSWSSSGRVYYEPDEIYYYEDPAAADALFPGEPWMEVSGLTRSQLEPGLDAQCDAALDSADVRDTDAFYAALSGRSAAEAAQKVSDSRAQRNATRYYRLLGAEESQKATTALLEGIDEQPYAAAAGWDAEYAQTCLRAVEVTYAIESDSALTSDPDGVFLQTFYLCEDPETGMWRVWGHDDGVELFGYEANLP